MSGFAPAPLPSRRGPLDEKGASVSAAESSATATPSGRACRRRWPSEYETRTDGIVTAASAPLIGGTESTSFATTTAMAPASWARLTFTTASQPARSTSAIRPCSSAPFEIGAHPSAGIVATSGPEVPAAGGVPPNEAVAASRRPASEAG